MLKNETKNSELFRALLRSLNYDKNADIKVEEQKSDKKIIRDLLKTASKTGSKNAGFPDFIISKKNSNTIIIVECKADNLDHGNVDLSKDFDYSNYRAINRTAENGIIYYMNFLKEKYNVIGVASSGSFEGEYKLTYFKQNKNSDKVERLSLEGFKTFENFELIFRNPLVLKSDVEIKLFAKQLNQKLYEDMNLSVEYRPPFITAIILALLNDKFSKGWLNNETGIDLAKDIIESAEKTLNKNGFSKEDSSSLVKNFYFIQTEKSIINAEIDSSNPFSSTLTSIIQDIDDTIIVLLKQNHGLDIIGNFYTEFLRYINGDKGDLGIVLTPRHICELMSDMVYLNKDSRVIDLCSGTGGFLVSAINSMTKMTDDLDKINNIKNNQTLGIELQSKMYLLLVSNMIVRGNYDNNLIYGNCFDFADKIKEFKPDRALQNPPYSQKDPELKFIKYTMDLLEKGGYGAFIVPKSVAYRTKDKTMMKYREEILKEHTLIACCSMNDDLFTPTSTCPVIMIFKAHEPHIDVNGKPLQKTFIADWSEDGHAVKKNCGRVDKGNWKNIKEKWIKAYRGKEETEISKMVYLTPSDEWIWESYFNSNYETTEMDVHRVILEYMIYKADANNANE